MKKSVAYCHLVARILAADGIMGEDERAYLEQTMDKFELSDDERDQVRHFEDSDDADEIVRALPRDEREALRDDLLGATLADGKISPLESQIMNQLSDVLDL